MNILNISLVSVFLLVSVSCLNTTTPSIEEELKTVSISSSETFEYPTGISGDEESATIAKHPNHYDTSKIVRDSSTNWEAVYKYKPISNFKGTDNVELKLGTGSDGASDHTNIKLVKIEIMID